MQTAVRSAPGAAEPRWLPPVCDGAVRLATVAAGLSPTLSSLGGAIVGALLASSTCWVGRRGQSAPGLEVP
jgi:hypothetical protein